MAETVEKIQLKNIDQSDWQSFRFDEIAQKISERVDPATTDLEVYVGLEHLDPDSIHIRRKGKPTDVKGEKLRCYPGDVIFGKRRAYQRKAALIDFHGICSAHSFIFRAIPEIIDPKLFPFFLHSDQFMHRAVDISVGGLSPTINWRELKHQEFLLPPKDQQAQIAELLWAMDEVVEREMQVSEKLNFALQSFFKHSVKDIRGKTIPLSKILVRKKEKSKPPHKLENYIGLEHIESGEFTCKKHGSSSDVLAQCNVIEPGDLCYSKLRPYLDKAFIASFKAVSTTELLIYDTRYVSKEYILYHFHSKAFLNYISFKGFGTKMPRVNHKSIGEYPIKIPDNEEQLLEKMKEFKTRIEEIKGKVKKSKSLQKSLINQIF